MVATKNKTYTEPKARFKVKDKIYLDYNGGKKQNEKSEITGPHEISKVSFQPITRAYMYQFTGMDIAVGECYLKTNKNDPARSFGSCIHDFPPDSLNRQLLDEGINWSTGELQSEGYRSRTNKLVGLFFRPDQTFIKWIVEYAAGRLMIDVGCGTGWLTEQIANAGGRIFGIDPFLDWDDITALNMQRIRNHKQMIQFLPVAIEQQQVLLDNLGAKGLMLFIRPCHSNFVENGLKMRSAGMEALYITVPANLHRYDDLGIYKKKAIKIEHEGWSADKEIVMSIPAKPEPKMSTIIKATAAIKNEKHAWTETFSVANEKDAEDDIKAIINDFNNSLKPGELKREFVLIIKMELLSIKDDEEDEDEDEEEDEYVTTDKSEGGY